MRLGLIDLVEWGVIALGVVLWVVALIRGRALEWFFGRSQLPEWHLPSLEFMVFALAWIVAMYSGPYLLVRALGLDWNARPWTAGTAMAVGYGAQIAWLFLCALFHLLPSVRAPGGTMRWMPALVIGIAGALLALPAIAAVDRVWRMILPHLGLNVELQDSVRFLREVDSVTAFFGWAGLVLVLAPLTEEWVFRRLVYRFFVSRLPDALAIVGSAVVFALPHGNAGSFVPLVVLGIALCLAYRYTGRLITPIAMHVVFNLNTLVYLVLGPKP